MKQNTLINQQFGNTAQAYLSSCVHAEGVDLQRITRLTHNYTGSNDLGCGAGHTAFAMAKAGATVTAYDLSPQMLALVENEAVRRGLMGITTQQGVAEKLPFADASFDLVATRFSAHHWTDVAAAMCEVRRVLKPTGMLIVIDVVAAENALFDTLLQAVEILRDASHIRDYRVSEWHAILYAAGFDVRESDSWTLTMEFPIWTSRMRTSELRVNAIRDVLSKASDEARQYFKVQADSSFDIDVAWLAAKPKR
jgi:ubiquinone/menaquinone biosynthesis C-methylase UbiE